jgi:hypothetical protein
MMGLNDGGSSGMTMTIDFSPLVSPPLGGAVGFSVVEPVLV